MTASLLPGAALLLLPKCPMCLAAWLTVATGVGVSASGAAWVQCGGVMLAVAGAAAFLLGRRVRRSVEP